MDRPEPWWPLRWYTPRNTPLQRANLKGHPWANYVVDREHGALNGRYRIDVGNKTNIGTHLRTDDLLELRCLLLLPTYPGGNDGQA